MDLSNLEPVVAWLATGFILLIIEMLLGMAGYLLWLGLSAVLVGGFTYVVSINWQLQVICFAVLAISFTLVWWRYQSLKDKLTAIIGNRPNQILTQLIGKDGVLTTAITNGKGRIAINDSSWIASSNEDIPQGAKVQVIAVNGTELVVKQIG